MPVIKTVRIIANNDNNHAVYLLRYCHALHVAPCDLIKFLVCYSGCLSALMSDSDIAEPEYVDTVISEESSYVVLDVQEFEMRPFSSDDTYEFTV